MIVAPRPQPLAGRRGGVPSRSRQDYAPRRPPSVLKARCLSARPQSPIRLEIASRAWAQVLGGNVHSVFSRHVPDGGDMRTLLATTLAGLLSCSSVAAAGPDLLQTSGVGVQEKAPTRRPFAPEALRRGPQRVARDACGNGRSAAASEEQALDGATSGVVRAHCRRRGGSGPGRRVMQRRLLPHRCRRRGDGRIVIRGRRRCVDRVGGRPGEVVTFRSPFRPRASSSSAVPPRPHLP